MITTVQLEFNAYKSLAVHSVCLSFCLSLWRPFRSCTDVNGYLTISIVFILSLHFPSGFLFFIVFPSLLLLSFSFSFAHFLFLLNFVFIFFRRRQILRQVWRLSLPRPKNPKIVDSLLRLLTLLVRVQLQKCNRAQGKVFEPNLFGLWFHNDSLGSEGG